MRTGLEHLVEKLAQGAPVRPTPVPHVGSGNSTIAHMLPPSMRDTAGIDHMRGLMALRNIERANATVTPVPAATRAARPRPSAPPAGHSTAAFADTLPAAPQPPPSSTPTGLGAATTTPAHPASRPNRYVSTATATGALHDARTSAGGNVMVADPEMAAGTVRGERRRPAATTSGMGAVPPASPAPQTAPQAAPQGRGSVWRYALPGAAVAAGLGAAAMAGNREDDQYRNLVYAPAPYG